MWVGTWMTLVASLHSIALAGLEKPVDAVLEVSPEVLAELSTWDKHIALFTSRENPIRDFKDLVSDESGNLVAGEGPELLEKVNRLLEISTGVSAYRSKDLGDGFVYKTSVFGRKIIGGAYYTTLFKENPNLRLYVAYLRDPSHEGKLLEGGAIRLKLEARSTATAQAALGEEGIESIRQALDAAVRKYPAIDFKVSCTHRAVGAGAREWTHEIKIETAHIGNDDLSRGEFKLPDTSDMKESNVKTAYDGDRLFALVSTSTGNLLWFQLLSSGQCFEAVYRKTPLAALDEVVEIILQDSFAFEARPPRGPQPNIVFEPLADGSFSSLARIFGAATLSNEVLFYRRGPAILDVLGAHYNRLGVTLDAAGERVVEATGKKSGETGPQIERMRVYFDLEHGLAKRLELYGKDGSLVLERVLQDVHDRGVPEPGYFKLPAPK